MASLLRGPLARTLALLAMAMVLPLGLAQHSFDDQYLGCVPAMAAALPALNRSEFQRNPLFARLWAQAAAEWQRRGPPESPLPPDQAIALMAFTMGEMYEEFSKAVSTAGRSRQEYRDNFHFKTLHFLLTQALWGLREAQGQPCQDVFGQVCGVRFEAQPGNTNQFNHFTLMSLSQGTAQCTEEETMEQVHTCYGVNIRKFSHSPGERDVLIPPFEIFRYTDITEEGDTTRMKLRSTGTFSKYNCEWLRGGSEPRAPFHLGGLLLATTALAVATGML